MMLLTGDKLDAYQRILGMLIASLPFWILLSGLGWFSNGEIPSQTQYFQTLVVAISSGVIATVLFFTATNKVRKDEKSLAAVEATQSSEVIFSLAGELLLINVILPDTYALIGMAMVILGMILHSIKS